MSVVCSPALAVWGSFDVCCFGFLTTTGYLPCHARRVFKQMVGKDLMDEIFGELSGNFRRLCMALLRDVYERDAYWLRKAMK